MANWKSFVRQEKNRINPPRRRRGLFLYGFKELQLQRTVLTRGGPEEFVRANARLFATGTTSRDEGYFYWALMKLIGPPGEPGINGLVWYYQSKVRGGSNIPGGAVVDFVVVGVGPNNDVGIRIVTPYFHIQAGPYKRATDFEQEAFLLDQGIDVVDVYSQNYIFDKSGRAVIRAARNAIISNPDFGPLHRQWRNG